MTRGEVRSRLGERAEISSVPSHRQNLAFVRAELVVDKY